MSKNIAAIRGMKDTLPQDMPTWHWVENKLRQIMASYAYQEIRTPILEKIDLFKRSVGEATDIVEKEMYSFEDRNGDSLCLRPEGTAGCMRAGIEHSLFYGNVQRLWYYGPLFRHERPQKGRYRQFYQCGVELCGVATAASDAEVIMLSAGILKSLGLLEHLTLQLNSLGSNQDRQNYRKALVEFYQSYSDQLDEDSQRRLETNPLRILDSKNPDMIAINQKAPKLADYLADDATQHFNELCQLLDHAGIKYEINPHLVRGLDYYCLTVFEWVTDKLGAQGTVCAGGRYDTLIQLLGGKPCPGIGFAMGMERIIALIEELNLHDNYQENPDIYLLLLDDMAAGLQLAQQLRQDFPNKRIMTDVSGASLKSQMKKADKSGAKIALILGADEIANQQITIKYLREDKAQHTSTVSELSTLLN